MILSRNSVGSLERNVRKFHLQILRGGQKSRRWDLDVEQLIRADSRDALMTRERFRGQSVIENRAPFPRWAMIDSLAMRKSREIRERIPSAKQCHTSYIPAFHYFLHRRRSGK